jgi:hypothetical protein
VVAAVVTSAWDTKGVVVMCIVLSVPLALIWFPEDIADYTKVAAKLGGRSRESPAPVLTFLGWLGLLGYFPLLAYLLAHKP